MIRASNERDDSTTMKTVFVAGTDTGVGKTYVSALLLQYLLDRNIHAGYQKWVSTGDAGRPADLFFCMQASGLGENRVSLDLQAPFRFVYPASPHLAAELEGRRIDSEIILDAYEKMVAGYERLVVEGVGGLLVPLRRDLLLIDLLALLRLPVLLVARSGLGTLNHTLLSLEAVRSRNIPTLGVVFSDAEEPDHEDLIIDNMRTVAEIGRIRVFGRLPRSDLSRHPQQSRKNFRIIGDAILEMLDRA
jgi:dethiobiotin synthetase